MNILERGLTILEILAEQPDGVSFTNINHRLGGINRASLSKTLKELIRLGYIMKDTDKGLYFLAPRINKLINARQSKKEWLINKYKRVLRELSDKYNITAILFERIGDSLISIHKEKTITSLTMQDVGSVNREIMSSPWMQVLAAFDTEIFNNIQNVSHKKVLKEVSKRGFAYDNQKIFKNIRRLGFPILDHNGQIIGCLGIGGTVFQITDKNINKIIKFVQKKLEGV